MWSSTRWRWSAIMRQWPPEPFLVFSVALMLVAVLSSLTKRLVVPALISSKLSLMLLQTSVGRADSRCSYFMDDWDMWQILNLLSSWRNQVFGLCGQKLWILNAMWATPWSCSSFAAILLITKECGLEVDCNCVQERAYAKAGSTLCHSTCFVLYSKTQSWALAHFFEVRYPLSTQIFPMDR